MRPQPRRVLGWTTSKAKSTAEYLGREPVPGVADFPHPSGYWLNSGTAGPERRDNASMPIVKAPRVCQMVDPNLNALPEGHVDGASGKAITPEQAKLLNDLSVDLLKLANQHAWTAIATAIVIAIVTVSGVIFVASGKIYITYNDFKNAMTSGVTQFSADRVEQLKANRKDIDIDVDTVRAHLKTLVYQNPTWTRETPPALKDNIYIAEKKGSVGFAFGSSSAFHLWHGTDWVAAALPSGVQPTGFGTIQNDGRAFAAGTGGKIIRSSGDFSSWRADSVEPLGDVEQKAT